MIRITGLAGSMIALCMLLAACQQGTALPELLPLQITPPATFLQGKQIDAPTSTPEQRLPTSTPANTNPVVIPLKATDIVEIIPSLCSPLDGIALDSLPEIISDPYLPPPKNNPEGRHHGVDFAFYNRGDLPSILGVTVQSILPGRVAAALADTFPYGKFVIVETPYETLTPEQRATMPITDTQSVYLLYAHLNSAPVLATGQEIAACGRIGEAGKSGNAGNPHLHLEMRLGPPGEEFMEMGFYRADDTLDERSNYQLWRTSGQFQHLDPMLLLHINPQAQVDRFNSDVLIDINQ